MKITMYELLGRVKDDKAPMKVIYEDDLYTYDRFTRDYYESECKTNLFHGVNRELNREVEIIEEEKKIPEKLGYCKENTFMEQEETTYLSSKERVLLDSNFKELGNKINEIIDYLKNKGDE